MTLEVLIAGKNYTIQCDSITVEKVYMHQRFTEMLRLINPVWSEPPHITQRGIGRDPTVMPLTNVMYITGDDPDLVED